LANTLGVLFYNPSASLPAGVAVPVALLVAGVVACVVAYTAYTRSRG
jgi:hypothetical protein